MRVADYIARFLADHGVRHLFMVTGGGAMHLNDAIGREAGLKYICCHHEQACAMAAESYARLAGRPAAINVTTGPGGINALNGVFGAWTDSIPLLVISGQVKRETCMAFNQVPNLRQLGDQEADLIAMASGITKYAALVRAPEDVRFHMEKAWHLATSGRPGPVWIDVPVDVQGAHFEPENAPRYSPEPPDWMGVADLPSVVAQVREHLAHAKRPLMMVGAGIRLGAARDALLELLKHWHLPIVTAWNSHDVIWDDHPRYAGRPGTLGDRAGNFAVQNSDVLLVIGSRLNIRQVGFNWSSFARSAYKIWVDIDSAELVKPTVHADLPIHCDARAFLQQMLTLPPLDSSVEREAWLGQCYQWRKSYPVVLPEYRQTGTNPINPYAFVEVLFSKLAADEIVVCADGTACVTAFQAAFLQPDQRLYTNSGSASMGYDLPAAVGAACASGKRVICLAGDGSFQMNIQELQTILTHRLAVKIFLLNNDGYHSIRQTQQNFFGQLHGCNPASGVEFPSTKKLAAAYGFAFFRASHLGNAGTAIEETLASPAAAICEIILDPNQPFAPKQSSRRLPDGSMVSAPLEDLAPFLDRTELKANMLNPPQP